MGMKFKEPIVFTIIHPFFISLTPLLHNPSPLLLVLLLRNPHLMKRPQTRQYTSPDPTSKFPLHWIRTRRYPNLGPLIRGGQFLLQAFLETGEEGTPARQDDVGE